MEKTFFAHPSAILDEGCEVGAGSKIWHFCHLMPGSKLGNNCVLGQNVFVAPGVVLGNGVKVQNNVSLYTGVTCDDDVFIGPSAVFTNVRNPRSFIERKDEFRSTHIGRGATIGANSTIVCGVDIGEYAFIGAGTVVTKEVPPYALIVGNPGQQVGWVSRRCVRLHFDDNNMAVCSESGEHYLLEMGEVTRTE